LINGKWKNCHLSGEEEYFICAYENLPYELDAHEYACNITSEKQSRKKMQKVVK
jgi:hypothetical protein